MVLRNLFLLALEDRRSSSPISHNQCDPALNITRPPCRLEPRGRVIGGQAGLHNHSLKVTAPMAQLLIDRIGPQMDQLANAIEKISTICDSRQIQQIDESIIVENSAAGGDGSAFELVDSWFEQDRARSLRVLSDIVERGALDEKNQRVRDPQRLLLQFVALSLKRARELRSVHRIVAEGGGEQQILEQAGIARPFLPRIRKQYRTCDLPRTLRIIETLIEMDWQLKSGAGALPVELMERAVVSI